MTTTPMTLPVGKRKLDLVGVYVTSDLKEDLEKWAEEEQRSVSKLAAIILGEAVAKAKEEGKIPNTQQEDAGKE